MSRRLQVLLPENDYAELIRMTKKIKITVAEWVRNVIRKGIQENKPISSEKKISNILKYAKYQGPTASIEQILKEIEKGKNS